LNLQTKNIKSKTTNFESETQSRTNCIVCNSTSCELLFDEIKDLEYETYKPVKYSICAKCRLIFQDPVPASELISNFYPDEYRNYLPVKKIFFSFLKNTQFKNQAKKITNYCRKNISDTKILEIGFGNGQLLLALKALGFKNLYGADFTDKMFSSLLENEISLKAANLEKEFPFDEKFDLIIMNNVIEHFVNPFQVLEKCKEHLNENGKIVLITPNTNALEFSIFKKYWAGFHAPRHIYLFNPENIKLTGEKLGFKNIIIEPGLDPGQWSISIQNIFQDNSFTRTKLQNGMAWYLLPLSLAVCPIAYFQNVIGKSTSIMCVLER